jgi:general secretion pathway protein K
MKRPSTHRSRGAAIVLAMLLAALAAAVAATVFADQQRWSRTVEHRRDQVQAQALALAGVQWGRQILSDDAQR